MTYTVPSAEDISEAFPSTPKPIQGAITVLSLLDLYHDLRVNARNTACPFSINGWLFVVLGITQYHEEFPFEAATCVVPPTPGPIPTGEAHTFPERKAKHDDDIARFEFYQNVKQALVKHITIAVGEDIVNTYVNASSSIPPPHELLEYLVRDYVRSTYKAQDVEAARLKMMAKISITDAWADFVRQIERGRDALRMYQQALTDAQLTNIALATLEHTGEHLRREIDKFRKRPMDQQKWEHIKEHFLPEWLAAAARQTAKHETDFNAAAHAVMGTTYEPQPQAAAHQVAAAASVDALAAAFQAFAAQQQQTMAQQQQTMALLTQQQQQQQQQQGGRGGGRGGGRRTMTPGRHGYYWCWTHGKCHHGHGHPVPAQQICNSPAPGHIATATFSNPQGGSMRNCEGWDGSTGL